MRTINIHQAKTHLSRLIEDAMRGESFVIAKAGKPMVLVSRLEAPEIPEPVRGRPLGLLEGQMTVPEDFDVMFQAEIETMFYGEA